MEWADEEDYEQVMFFKLVKLLMVIQVNEKLSLLWLNWWFKEIEWLKH